MERLRSEGPWYSAGLRGAAEGGAAAALGCAVLWRAPLSGEARDAACWGVALAWAACTPGVFGLAYGSRSTARAFWTAFGLGMLLRAAVLAGLMARAWNVPARTAAAGLCAYAVGLAGMLLVEFRHLARRG